MAEACRVEVDGRVIVVLDDDLTAQDVDAVVNAANEQLAHGGGVAAALVRAGGEQVQAASDAWVAHHGPVGPGQAAVTSAGKMPARRVVHVVGPRYRQGQDNAALLRQAVGAALAAARDAGSASVALPAISAGVFGYPPDDATRVIAAEVVAWLRGDAGGVREVRLVGYGEAMAQRFADAVRGVTG